MKKFIIIILILLAVPVLLQAQYTGGNGRGDVMLESLNNVLTGTANNISTLPTEFALEQNYPNPFNPMTSIEFQVSSFKFVKLKVFDIIGKEVATLVNEKLSAGTYSVNWDAAEFPSGVYFYRLTTDGYSETKRMLLLK